MFEPYQNVRIIYMESGDMQWSSCFGSRNRNAGVVKSVELGEALTFWLQYSRYSVLLTWRRRVSLRIARSTKDMMSAVTENSKGKPLKKGEDAVIIKGENIT